MIYFAIITGVLFVCYTLSTVLPKLRKHKKRTSEEMIVFDHLTAHNSTVLNNELSWRNTDWASEASDIKSLLAKSKQ